MTVELDPSMQITRDFKTQFNEIIKPKLKKIQITLTQDNEPAIRASIQQFRHLFQIITQFTQNFKGSDSTGLTAHILGYMRSEKTTQKKQIDRDELFQDVKSDVAEVLRYIDANKSPSGNLEKMTSIYDKLQNLHELCLFERDLVAFFTPKIKDIRNTLYSFDEITVRACIQKIRNLFIGINKFIIARNRLDYRGHMQESKTEYLYHAHRIPQKWEPRKLVEGVKDDLAFILSLIESQRQTVPDNILIRLSVVLAKLRSIVKLYGIYAKPQGVAARCSNCDKLISM
jgi:hypothetical protein